MLVGLGTITANSNFWEVLAHPIDAISYSIDALQSNISALGEPDIAATLPPPIVASQAPPTSAYEMRVPGAWTPEQAATQGIATEKSANSAMLTSYLAQVQREQDSFGIPWGTIAVVGIVAFGVAVVLRKL